MNAKQESMRITTMLIMFLGIAVHVAYAQAEAATGCSRAVTARGNGTPGINAATAARRHRRVAVRFGADGLVFSNEDGSEQLKVHGFAQGDGRFFSSDLKDSSPDRLLWRRIRPNF